MFSTAVASACLSVLQWLLWLTAGLLLLLIVVQALRGDADAQPGTTAMMAVLAGAVGWMFGAAGRRLARR